MRTMKAVAALAMVLLLGRVVLGDDAKKAAAPPLTWATTMPAIEISKQPLEKVLNDLKKKLPGFNFSISRENVPHDYPVLPAMSVENVSLADFFDLVTREVPGVTIKLNGGGPVAGTYDAGQVIPLEPVMCVVNIVPNPESIPTTQPTVVRVFGLAELIAYRSVSIEGVEKREDRDKQASNEILSMIQAALDVAGDPTVPVMKMHAPTQTLIFKGTEAQAQIVESAIKALHTGDGVAIRREEDLMLHQRVDIDNLEAENRKLKQQLAEAMKSVTTKPAK